MLPDPIVFSPADTLPTFTVGVSSPMARVRQQGQMTEYVCTSGIASATQPLFLRITQKKRTYGVQGPSKFRVDVEYHIDVAAVNGVPQADRPIKFSLEFDGNTFDSTVVNRNRVLNVAFLVVSSFFEQLMAGQS